jgi:RluA family pseudouridine synthase
VPHPDVEQAAFTRQGDTITVRVPEDYADEERLDKYLTRFFPQASRTKVQRSIRKGQALVNGADIKKSYAVQAGDTIVCRLVQPPPIEAEPQPIPLDIAYEDDALLVVNKPAGMVVHPAHGHRRGTLVNALLHHVDGQTVARADADLDADELGLSMVNALPERPGNPSIRPGIVHRLDKDTSGLLVVAKTDVAHRRLARQFKEHTTHRRYVAIVWGHPEPPSGSIEGAIGRDPHNRKRMAVVPDESGKAATTHYEVIERHAHTALVQFQLETGRTHQIRVHASDMHHPLLGDPTYGGQSVRYGSQGGTRRRFFEHLFERMPRQALHAAELGFTHPMTSESMRFTADLPDDMQHVLDRLRSVEGG